LRCFRVEQVLGSFAQQCVSWEAVDPDKGDRYRMHISLEGDPGEVSAYSGEATFQEAIPLRLVA
jgi:hypothetical protein